MSFPTPTTILLRVLNLTGLVLLGLAWLLKEREEGTIQSQLEEMWMVVAGKQQSVLAKTTAFVQGAASLTAKAFDGVFGHELLSIQELGVSICFSIVSFFVFVIASYYLVPRKQAIGSPLLVSICAIVLYAGFGLVPNAWQNRWWQRIWLLLIIVPLLKICAFLVYVVYKAGHGEIAVGIAVILGIAFLVSIACDVLYVWLTRWMLHRISRTSHLGGMLLLVLGSVGVAAALISIPAALSYELLREWPMVAIVTAFLAVVLNIFDLIVCSALFIVALLLLAHRVMWPLLERIAYALQRYRILQEKGRLTILGLALLTLPTHTTGSVFMSMLWKL